VSVKFLRRVVDLARERGRPPPRRGEALPRPYDSNDRAPMTAWERGRPPPRRGEAVPRPYDSNGRAPMTAWERGRPRPHAAKMAALQ